MSSFSTDITEQYLNKVYEDLQKEQMKLMNDMKTGCDNVKEKDITKQITLINTINVAIMRLRNTRKKVDI
jgi:predicted ATPase